MKSYVFITSACALSLLSTGQADEVIVTNNNDAGAGSFRQAVIDANGDASIDTIKFGRAFTIGLDSAVTYSGDQALSIDGNRSTITAGAAAGDLFVSEGGADLAVCSLSVTDSAAAGIVVNVPATAGGYVSVSLAEVSLLDNTLEGLLVDDQDEAAASIVLTVERTTVSGNGNGASDHDGIRVNETGEGDILSTVRDSRFDANGGDGLELDERGEGDLDFVVSKSTFNDNGFQDPDDLEDGIDLDERDDGTIWVNVSNISADGNADQGLDFDEDDDGEMVASVEKTKARGNGDSGIKIDENNNGGLTAELSQIVAKDNGDDSIRIKEDNDGDLAVLVTKTVSIHNAGFGLSVEQDDDGSGTLNLQQVNLSNNEGGELETEGL